MNKEGINLKALGSKETVYPKEPDRKILETFENKYPKRDYTIHLSCPEFTSLCPKTGQPDFAEIVITYTPDKKCIETKSLKLYLFSYRTHGSFMEPITNRILDDLVAVCKPQWMEVIGSFSVRGGIAIVVTAEYNEGDDEESVEE